MAIERPYIREDDLAQEIYRLLVAKGSLPKDCRDFQVIANLGEPLRVIAEYFPDLPQRKKEPDGQNQR